jgi:hypothetical protein
MMMVFALLVILKLREEVREVILGKALVITSVSSQATQILTGPTDFRKAGTAQRAEEIGGIK